MIAFVVPLKSKKIARSWQRTSQLFERCLRSICRQTNSNFTVIVVCHEKPEIEFTHPNVHYIEVDFKIPDKDNFIEKEKDKGKKIITGLRYARQFSVNHAMVVDADDCLSCHLAEFTARFPDAEGWFLHRGYVYQESSPWIYYRKSHFYSWCGTCNIVRLDLFDLPEIERIHEYPDERIIYHHRTIKDLLADRGVILQELPFAGATYIIGHGENFYQSGFSTIHKANKGKLLFSIKELFKFRPLTSSLRREFGLDPIPPES